MPDEARLLIAFALAAVTTLLLVPVVTRLAERTGFLDLPVGYKEHGRPTPYLGGLAIVGGFLLAAISLGDALGEHFPILALGVAMCAVGTLDDRVNLGPFLRLGIEAAAAVVLWSADLGWNVFDSGGADLALTVIWITGLVNAFNLMDNLDGAAGSVGAVAAGGAAVLALAEGHVELAVLGAALAGACAGFLPANLSRPSKVFMGDGGSMPIGFLVAATVMATPVDGGAGWRIVLAALPIVGLPVLDMALVIVSRRRSGAQVLSGARDHTTHRLLLKLGSARAVAATLAIAQAVLCVTGIAILQLEPGQMLAASVIMLGAGVAAVAALETPQWAPQRQES